MIGFPASLFPIPERSQGNVIARREFVLSQAERAALAAEVGYPPAPYPGAPYPSQYPGGQPYPGAPYAGTVDPNAAPVAPQYTEQESTAIVPVPLHDLATQDQDPEGGQS